VFDLYAVETKRAHRIYLKGSAAIEKGMGNNWHRWKDHYVTFNAKPALTFDDFDGAFASVMPDAGMYHQLTITVPKLAKLSIKLPLNQKGLHKQPRALRHVKEDPAFIMFHGRVSVRYGSGKPWAPIRYHRWKYFRGDGPIMLP
jgi:hypothetical protein